MSAQILPIRPPIRPVDPAPRVVPGRPVSLRRTNRSDDQTDTMPNLFTDVFSGVLDAPTSPAARARDRARRLVETAVDRSQAQALPHLTNFWQADLALQQRPNPAANLPAPQPDTETQTLRQILCAKPDTAPDAPATPAERNRLRLAVHAMNTTMTIAYPPMGAVVMTYSFLRGESMRLTTRSLVLMGAVMGLMHGHLPGV
ncbi:MAG: hypothetical protein CFE34_14920 [Rhodobacteraceae bacterium PARR1]|nr:MAG: hypothetical protein CFE34_14920 [Rhodobacteraceae bacterium PARR1]